MARLAVMHFAEAMEGKLAKNDAKKGSEGWRDASPERLLSYLKDEVDELETSIKRGNGRQMMEECADVANMAMMIFDNQRTGLQGIVKS